MEMMQSSCIPTPIECITNDEKDGCLTLALQNVQNLLTHKEDVMSNCDFTSADIICMTETHLQ